ncbi:MAG: Holliday junction resolvase RecU [Lachnospiraceae bacterium]|nr:Holliday junction resolvase RecU [Lachnospiraceae bacterium]
MATWNSRGLRGSLLEEMLNRTNEKYREQHLALIQKVPTPITPVRIDPDNRQISLAYFDQKSTVDYIGVIQGLPVCFDAKESATTTFSLQNVHPHQVSFMQEFERQEGIAFFLIYYKSEEIYYYLPFRHFLPFWERAEKGGRKSFRFEELDRTFVLGQHQGIMIPYLEMINKDILEREENTGRK